MKLLSFALLAACSPKGPATPRPTGDLPHLVASSELGWYRVDATCAQGPFELEVAATGAKYGEIVELELHTTHAIAIDAAVLFDGRERDRIHGTFDRSGPVGGPPANAACLASDHAKLVAGAGAPAGPGGTNAPSLTGTPRPPPSTTAPPLVPSRELVPVSSSILTFHVPLTSTGRITIRFWSVEPNDLTGVAFGLAHVVMRPNIGEAAYDQYLANVQASEEARLHVAVAAPVVVATETAEDLARRERSARAAEESARREQQDRIARERQAAIDAALAEERERSHRGYCAAHHEDRDCWGPGGFAGYHALELRVRERERYCGANPEDARCWTSDELARRRAGWHARVELALQAEQAALTPSGPPPAPLEDPQPPQPSMHAAWRPGYWSWDEGQWVWLAGQWNVPDQDVIHEQTATAPQPPPPAHVETPPPPPVATVAWIPGFWMWNRTQWIWIAGSYQLAQTGRTWSPPQWRARGAVHVFVPGGWLSR